MIEEAGSLFTSISNDLGIKPFSLETESRFRCRLIYSAVSDWVLRSVRDRDIEGTEGQKDYDQVSKSHVTGIATSVLSSFKKIDDSVGDFFPKSNEKDLANDLEDIYLRLGYFDSGDYAFLPSSFIRRVLITDSTSLLIDDKAQFLKMVGVGRLDKTKSGDLPLDKYFVGEASAEGSFIELSKRMNYSAFSSDERGLVEFYNSEKKRWDLFDVEKASRFPFSVLRFGHMTYALLKWFEGKPFSASLPEIYNTTAKDINYSREIWRIILGLSANIGNPHICRVSTFCGDGVLLDISSSGCVLPLNELAILRCLSWPVNNCLDQFGFVTYSNFVDPILFILKRLSFIIDDER
ncbi:MAG: hypothetical protein LKG11_06060 [Bacilli bacterium]|jgi:hypothetical protein|nr:hypothetical protein [Bacilli bacterium]